MGWVPFPTRLADGQSIEDPSRPRLDLGLTTLSVGFSRGTGPGFELQLPVGLIARADTVNGAQRDLGVGDLEVRGRFVAAPGRFRLTASAGVALPTGAYAARSGQVGLQENARYLTLGRGTTWFLADLDGRLALPGRFGVFVSGTTRVALYEARDGFRWGPEVRATGGATFGPIVDRLSFALGFEVQWRAQSSEVDLFAGGHTASVNTGGTWLTATPSAQVRVMKGLAVFLALRVPVTQWAQGLQFVPGPGVFLGVGGTFELIGPTREVPKAKPGRVTVVDYWATWCEPCLKLKPLLEEARLRHPELVVKEVDASDWESSELAAALPGVAGLPALEVYRRDGSLMTRLVGEDVFDFEKVLEEALK